MIDVFLIGDNIKSVKGCCEVHFDVPTFYNRMMNRRNMILMQHYYGIRSNFMIFNTRVPHDRAEFGRVALYGNTAGLATSP
ncbi:hypothetical protein GCM10009007_19490 [Formosimonas limnophila]|uniref:Uncharacterized protein n=1 Tax=Formosimonas limnophila TaxID=1384487 RepID=A0A8J3CPE8_9BURK|nr:hypothetical protein GCM10009007_19490 [Formosimonas limnophila]